MLKVIDPDTTGYYTFQTKDNRILKYFATSEVTAISICAQDWHHQGKDFKVIEFERIEYESHAQ